MSFQKMRFHSAVLFSLILWTAISGGTSAIAGNQAQYISLEERQPESIPLSGSPFDDYTFDVDDELRVTVYDEPDLSGEHKLGSKGIISIPLIGEVRIIGLTVSEAEKLIEDRLSDGFLVDPDVIIEVTSREPVYILGEVRVPGGYDYAADMSVLNAVALAGGFTYRARQDTVQLLRPREDPVPLYEDVSVHTKLRPGDIILVEERFF